MLLLWLVVYRNIDTTNSSVYTVGSSRTPIA